MWTRDLFFKWHFLYYLTGPIIFFLIGDQIIDQLGDPTIYIRMVSDGPSIVAQSILNVPWYPYLSAALVFDLSAVVMAGYFMHDVFINFSRPSRLRILIGVSISFGINMLIIVIEPLFYTVP